MITTLTRKLVAPKELLAWVVILGIIGLYFFHIFYYMENLPFLDDYNAAFEPTKKFFEAPTLLDKLKILFSTHDVHNILVTRLAFIACYLLLGQFNFAILCIFNSCLLLWLVFYLYKIFARLFPTFSLWYFVPILFMFLHLGALENTLWAMSGLQNVSVVLLAIALFYHIGYGKKTVSNLAVCMVLGFFATFCSGNGLLAALLVIPLMAYQRGLKNVQLYAWVAFCVLLLYLKPLNGVVATVNDPLSNPVFNTLYRPENVLVNIMLSLGALYGNPKFTLFFVNRLVVVSMAAVVLLSFLFSLQTQFQKNKTTLLAFVFFVIGSIVAISAVRGIYLNNVIFNSRYMIYSSCFSACTYCLLLAYLSTYHNQLIKIFVFAMLIFYAANYYQITKAGLHQIESHRRNLVTYALLWQDGGSRPVSVDYMYKDLTQIAKIYGRYYQIPAQYNPKNLQTSAQTTNRADSTAPYQVATEETRVYTEQIGITNNYIFLSGQAVILYQDSYQNEILVELSNSENSYTFCASTGATLYQFHNPLYLNSFFTVVIAKKSIATGNYAIRLLVIDKKTKKCKAIHKDLHKLQVN